METEEQQVEQLKAFWKEHGKGIIAGLVIGFALFYGWRYYDAQMIAQQEAQSEQFMQIVAELEADAENATTTAQNFIQEHSDSAYGHLAAFELANDAIEAGELATAVTALQTVRDNASGALKYTADVRQARVLLAQEQYDAALAAITAAEKAEAFKATAAELRGDILLAKGDNQGAREAYQAAIAANEANAPLVEIKLNSIAADS